MTLLCFFQIDKLRACCFQAHDTITSSYLTVASSEILAAGTGVLLIKGVFLIVGRWQSQTRAPIQAGLAFAEL